MTEKSAQGKDIAPIPEIHDRKSMPEAVRSTIGYPGPLSYPVDQGSGCFGIEAPASSGNKQGVIGLIRRTAYKVLYGRTYTSLDSKKKNMRNLGVYDFTLSRIVLFIISHLLVFLVSRLF